MKGDALMKGAVHGMADYDNRACQANARIRGVEESVRPS